MPGVWDSWFTIAVFLGPQTVSCHSAINNRPAFVCLLASFGYTHTNFLRTQQTTRVSQSFSVFFLSCNSVSSVQWPPVILLPFRSYLTHGIMLNFRSNSCLSFPFRESNLKLCVLGPTGRPRVPSNHWTGTPCSGSPCLHTGVSATNCSIAVSSSHHVSSCWYKLGRERCTHFWNLHSSG